MSSSGQQVEVGPDGDVINSETVRYVDFLPTVARLIRLDLPFLIF